MTGPFGVGGSQDVPQDVTAGVEAMIGEFDRLGARWRLRAATVIAGSSTLQQVTLDGDSEPVPIISMVGALAVGSRVWCVSIPPSGTYVIGRLGVTASVIDESFTATGASTWEKPPGYTRFYVQVQAGGAAGCGAAATGVSQWSFGDGGGAGEYAAGWFTADQLPDTVTVTVGAGGAGVSGASGAAGGASSFDTYITTVGGGAAAGRPASSTLRYSQASVNRTGGGGGTGGSLRVFGGCGGSGHAHDSTSGNQRGGDGGGSHLGGGVPTNDSGANGNTGRLYGGGGSGASNPASNAARTGGSGADGLVVVSSFV